MRRALRILPRPDRLLLAVFVTSTLAVSVLLFS
jgi:hypothetical protein